MASNGQDPEPMYAPQSQAPTHFITRDDLELYELTNTYSEGYSVVVVR